MGLEFKGSVPVSFSGMATATPSPLKHEINQKKNSITFVMKAN